MHQWCTNHDELKYNLYCTKGDDWWFLRRDERDDLRETTRVYGRCLCVCHGLCSRRCSDVAPACNHLYD
jgi:hypothetical protein